MIFCGQAKSVEGLVEAGFDVMSLANNHSLNYGSDGLEESARILTENNILAVTSNLTWWGKLGDKDLAVLAADDVTSAVDMEMMTAAIHEATESAELVMAIMHWGAEYQATPSARHVEMGHELVDAGVDVVLGSHPHWVQSAEEYNGGIILYSLGNFVFDQMWSEETRQGAIGEIEVTFVDDELAHMSYDLIPIKIYDYGQPRLE